MQNSTQFLNKRKPRLNFAESYYLVNWVAKKTIANKKL